MRPRLALSLALLAGLVAPAAASAHAVLVESVPARGATLREAPGQVVLRFNEPVELAFGSARVFDAEGDRVDVGAPTHPDGDGRAVRVALRDELPDGAYTATYRVVSADSHPVDGGFVFQVGDAAGSRSLAVSDLLESSETGPATDVAFGAVKAISYAAIAVAVGGVVFVLAVWIPALGGLRADLEPATAAFAARARLLAAATVATGAFATLLGLVLQTATAAGISAWEALDPGALVDLLETRFGTIWGLRLLAWLGLGLMLALNRVREIPLGALLAVLVVSPALAGHAGASDPRAPLLAADILHVLAMSVWVGGIAMFLLAVPAATRRLERSLRTRLLAAALSRFSQLALAAVAVLLASGLLQSILHLEAPGDLVDTAFGRAILVKAALLAGLVGLGAHNRRRSLPRLRVLAQGAEPLGSAGVILRRSLRAELVLFAAALAATAALTTYPPPTAVAAGPFAATTELGPARLELTVDPAGAGPNEIHLYLTDPRTGAQQDRLRNVELALRLPDKAIGPLEPRVHKAGPGHWVARRAQIAPAGDWRLTVAARVSDFEEARAVLEVPISPTSQEER